MGRGVRGDRRWPEQRGDAASACWTDVRTPAAMGWIIVVAAARLQNRAWAIGDLDFGDEGVGRQYTSEAFAFELAVAQSSNFVRGAPFFILFASFSDLALQSWDVRCCSVKLGCCRACPKCACPPSVCSTWSFRKLIS
jgi:hypothetical protein